MIINLFLWNEGVGAAGRLWPESWQPGGQLGLPPPPPMSFVYFSTLLQKRRRNNDAFFLLRKCKEKEYEGASQMNWGVCTTSLSLSFESGPRGNRKAAWGGLGWSWLRWGQLCSALLLGVLQVVSVPRLCLPARCRLHPRGPSL